MPRPANRSEPEDKPPTTPPTSSASRSPSRDPRPPHGRPGRCRPGGGFLSPRIARRASLQLATWRGSRWRAGWPRTKQGHPSYPRPQCSPRHRERGGLVRSLIRPYLRGLRQPRMDATRSDAASPPRCVKDMQLYGGVEALRADRRRAEKRGRAAEVTAEARTPSRRAPQQAHRLYFPHGRYAAAWLLYAMCACRHTMACTLLRVPL